MAKIEDSVAEVHETSQTALTTFQTKWEEMQENSRFIRLDQYSRKQLDKMTLDGRTPYVWDYVTQAVNTYLGIQRDRRTEIFYYPVRNEDALRCEILNAVKDTVLAQNNFIYLESDVFQDGLVEKVGAVGYEWTTERDKNGSLRMFKIPPRQVMWDYSCMEYDKSDAHWMRRHRLFSKTELKARYPDHAKEIGNLSLEYQDYQDSIGNGVSLEYLSTLADKDLNSLLEINFFKYVYEDRWYIIDPSSGTVFPKYYDTKKDAEDRMRELRAAGAPRLGVKRFRTRLVKKTDVVNNLLLNEEIIDEPFIPIDIYHPFWHDGDWFSVVDTMKDAQKFINKMASQIDHWIGTMSKGLLLIDDKVPKPIADKVREAYGKTGGTLTVPDPTHNFHVVEAKGPAPQLFSMIELATSNLNDHSGGRNFQGKKETASESGVAVRTRIEQGGLAGFVIYDNLRRWKMSVGDKVAWYLTHYMTAPQKVRIMGDELVQETMGKMNAATKDWFSINPLRPGVGFLEVNTTEQNTLQDMKVDTIVDEARWSVSKNESTLQQINGTMQSNPAMAQSFDPMTLIDLLPLPFSQKEKAKARTMELMQQQMALEQAKAQKPPSLSASVSDVQYLSPMAAVQLLAMFGIQVPPEASQSPADAASYLTSEIAKAKAEQELRHKEETHQIDVEAKSQDMVIKATEGEQKLAHGERTMAFKERQGEKKREGA